MVGGLTSSRAVLGMLALTLAAVPGYAQMDSDKPDPRRMDAAKIVTDPNPMSDPKGENDIDRVSDSYQPKGIELGEFLLLPQIEIEESYNSNIYAQKQGAKGDFITTVRPEMKLRSQTKQHAFNTLAYLDYKHFWTYSNDDVLDGEIFADGRYDINSTTNLNASVDFISRHEERGTSDDIEGDEPTPTRSYAATLGGKTQQGKYIFEASSGVTYRDFDDVATSAGTMINNDDRDRTELLGSLRGAYEMFPGYAAVAKLTGNSRWYDSQRDDSGLARDSYGFRAEAGLGVDLTQLIRGDFLVGYLHQDYSDPSFADPSGLSFKAAFNWTPSRMTLVVPALERSVEETTLTSASAIVRSSATLLVRHELARNILLAGFAGVYYDEYEGTPYTSLTAETNFRVTYAFTPEVYLSGQVGYKKKDSDVPDSSYDQAVVGLRLGFRY